VQLAERHVIKRGDVRFASIDAAAFASKNLYNKALYATRQAFFRDGAVPSYPALYYQMKGEPEYTALPRKVAQWVLKQVCLAWESYRKALAAYATVPSAFLGKPRLPRYLDKQGRNLLVYTTQALSRPGLQLGRIRPSSLGIEVPTRQTHVVQVRIIPRGGFYIVEVIHERTPIPTPVNPELYAGVDLGLNNLALLTSNKAGFIPQLVNGRPVKSINQYYNKRRAKLQSVLGHRRSSQRLERLTTRRTRRIDHYLHAASRRIVDLLVREGIGTLIIGKNPLWKQEANMGKRINQNFVSVPHARFIEMLTYKAGLVSIRVILAEESHTSKCSFLDWESIGHHEQYAGRQVKRGLFRAANGQPINADANGSYNIIRKVAPEAFTQGSRGCVVHPVRLAV
jgi:putative transposase